MKTGQIKKALKRLDELGGVTRHLDSVVSYWRTEFEPATDGDYSFFTNIYADGGASLSARRAGAPDGEYFWGRGYGADDYASDKALLEAFVNDVVTVLASPTRIRQSKGFLFYAFSCEVNRAGAWEGLGEHTAFRYGGFKFPPAKKRVTEYQSPALPRTNRGQSDATLEKSP